MLKVDTLFDIYGGSIRRQLYQQQPSSPSEQTSSRTLSLPSNQQATSASISLSQNRLYEKDSVESFAATTTTPTESAFGGTIQSPLSNDGIPADNAFTRHQEQLGSSVRRRRGCIPGHLCTFTPYSTSTCDTQVFLSNSDINYQQWP